MRVYVLGGQVCYCHFQRTGMAGLIEKPVLLPAPGLGWQVVLDFPGLLEALSDSIPQTIANLSSDYGFFYRTYVSTKQPVAILQGYRWHSDGIDHELLNESKWKLHNHLVEHRFPCEEDIELYGPDELVNDETLPLNWKVMGTDFHAVDEDGPVLGIWAPSDSTLTMGEAAKAVLTWIRDNGPVSHIITSSATVAGRAAAKIACLCKIPFTYVSAMSTPRDLYHAAAQDVISNPEWVTPLLSRASSILCMVDSEARVPPVFRTRGLEHFTL